MYNNISNPNPGQLCYCEVTPFVGQPSTFLIVKILSIRRFDMSTKWKAEITFCGDSTCYWVSGDKLFVANNF